MIKNEGIKIVISKDKLIPVFVGTAIFIFTITIFRSTLTSIAKLRLENKRAEKRLSILERKRQLLQSLDKEEVSRRVKDLEKVFPSEKPALNLIASLSRLALDNNVVFSGIELKPGRIDRPEQEKRRLDKGSISSGKLHSFLISFNIEGGYDNIISFVNGLEKTAPLMRIDDVALASGGTIALLKVKVYYQSLPETLGPIDQEVPLLSQKEKVVLEEIADYQQPEVVQLTAPVGKTNLFSPP